MSGELEIPERAYDEAAAAEWAEMGAQSPSRPDLKAQLDAAVTAAAPIIVAAAFRKRAHEVEARAIRVRGNNPATVTESLIAQAQQLRNDADELDPPAVNP